MHGEIASKLLNVGESQAEEALNYIGRAYLTEDFYLEMMRHGQEDEERVNETFIRVFEERHDDKYCSNQ